MPIVIIVGAIVVVALTGLFAYHLIRGGGKRVNLGKSRAREVATDGGQPPCKETCDIYGKVGDPIRYDCGHDDAPEFKIDLWGEPTVHKKPDKGAKFCAECLRKEILALSIRCGNCGYAIKPGDPISLCVDDGSGKKEWRTVFDGNLALCLRWECDSAPGYCGHWMGNGIKPAFPDGGNQISQAFNSGEPVFTQIGPIDLGKKEGP